MHVPGLNIFGPGQRGSTDSEPAPTSSSPASVPPRSATVSSFGSVPATPTSASNGTSAGSSTHLPTSATTHPKFDVTLNASLADSVRAGIAPEDDEDEQGEDDDEEMDRSDMEDESGEVEGAEDWVDEDGDLGPEDGEADEEEVFNDHYVPF